MDVCEHKVEERPKCLPFHRPEREEEWVTAESGGSVVVLRGRSPETALVSKFHFIPPVGPIGPLEQQSREAVAEEQRGPVVIDDGKFHQACKNPPLLS